MRIDSPWESFRDGAVVVTGAAGGIGEQIVRRALALGATVVASDLSASALAARMPARERLVLHTGDAADAADIAALEEQVRATGVPLRLWVNSAGIIRRASAAEFDTAAWDAVMAVNVRSALLGSQAAQRLFTDGGSIVNLSSIVTRRTMPGRAAYATSKAAVEQLTRQLALEWGPEGIRVNAVAPGFVLTPISHLADASVEERAETVAEIPLRRLGEIEDIADLTLLLGTAATAYVTGQTISADGGLSIG